MRQLSGLDAQYLMEDGRTHMHVVGLAVLDATGSEQGPVTRDALVRQLRQRMHLMPPLRWRLVTVPFNLDYPYWIDDASFDLEFHVREVAVAPPGSDADLADLVADIASRPLDRARPLWEMYLVHGLPEGRTGLITKLHHAAIDGVSGTELFSVLCDTSPAGREVDPPIERTAGEREPGQLEMLVRGMAGNALQATRALGGVPGVLPNLDAVPTLRSIPGVKTVSGTIRRIGQQSSGPDGKVLEIPRAKTPRLSVNGHITPHRRVAFASLSLVDLKAVKNHFGVTVNDVVVAICTGALRTWLTARGELPEGPLIAVVPLSVRPTEESSTYGNQISLMVVEIPTDEPDPKRRLERVHHSLHDAKLRYRAIPATLLQDVNEFIPPALLARAGRAMLHLGASGRTAPGWNALISSVPGSQVPLYCCGARIVAHYPTSAIMHGAGLTITVISYLGRQLDFGIIGDRDQLQDAWPLMNAIGDELSELTALLP